MRVASWNIRGNTGVKPARRAAIIDALTRHNPCVLVLQEVAWKGGLHEDLTRRLAHHGWPHACYGGVPGSPDKRYGNLIASRFPVQADASNWAPGVPWRQSLLKARVDTHDGPIDVVGAHIPNGSGNGWAKVETFEALARGLEPDALVHPTILAGDFNEPMTVLDDGTIVPFSMRQRRDGTWTDAGLRTAACGRTFPRERWTTAVRAVLGRSPSIGLRRVRQGVEEAHEMRVTHEVRGYGRCFDHLLVSEHWAVVAAGVEDDVRMDGTSDHSLIWSDLRSAQA